MKDISGQLKVYKCHKIVHATPMQREEFSLLKYGVYIPAEESDNAEDEGYCVVYAKGTSHEYMSWTPKHVFEAGYRDADGYLTKEEHAKVHLNIVQYELNERLADVFHDPDCDQRCLAIARTHLESAFMYLARSYDQFVHDRIDGRHKSKKKNGFQEFIEGLE